MVRLAAYLCEALTDMTTSGRWYSERTQLIVTVVFV